MASAAEIEIQALRDLNNTAPNLYITAPTLASPAEECFTVNRPEQTFNTWTPISNPYGIWREMGDYMVGKEEFNWMLMRPDKKSFFSRLFNKEAFTFWNILKWVAVIGSCAAAIGSLM